MVTPCQLLLGQCQNNEAQNGKDQAKRLINFLVTFSTFMFMFNVFS